MEQIERKFAELAVKQKLATREQVDECVAIVEEVTRIGAPACLADTMVHKKYISRADADSLLAKARAGGGPRTSLAGYELLARLGQGAMGVVYKARQVSVDRIVAIKILRPQLNSDKSYLERFIREARSAAKLNHPNVVRAIDAGSADGYHYFVMEFADGPTAAEQLENGPLAEARALEITREMSKALAHAHEHGIVHRDIKPGNIMLLADGAAKLADLGLAKTFQADSSVTVDGRALGTPNYMSPEQARGDADLDGRSDIYSLGATLFHLVSGTAPFLGRTAAEVISKLLTRPPTDVQALCPGLSPATVALIRKMMAKDPAQRQQTAVELLADVEAASAGQMPQPALARAVGEAPPHAKGKKLRALAAAGILVLAGILAVALWPRGPSARERAESALTAAVTYGEQNPDDPDGAIERLLAVIADYKHTNPAARAERLVQDIRARTARQAVMRAIADLKKDCNELARQDRYADAIALTNAFVEKHDDELSENEAAILRGELRAAARKRATDLARQTDDALDKKDYARARAALEAVTLLGLYDVAERAREKLAEIDALEHNAQRSGRWNEIKTAAAKLRNEGRYEEAIALIETAKKLPLPKIADLADEQIAVLRKALAEVQLASEEKYRAAFAARVKPLLTARNYKAARAALEQLGARQDLKHAAESLGQSRADLDRLDALWQDLEQYLGALEPRQVLHLKGKDVRFAGYEEGVIRYKDGPAEKGVGLAAMSAREILALTPNADEEAHRLRTAAFLLYDNQGDLARAYDLLDTEEQHPDAQRYRAMATQASRARAREEEKAAEAALEKLQNHTAAVLADALKNATANPELLDKPLADLRAQFGHTRIVNEHLADLAAIGTAFRAIKSLKAWRDSYYLLVKTNTPWHDAAARCKTLGGHLVIITTAAEQAFVVEEFMKPRADKTRPGIWLGATNETDDGKWRWISDNNEEWAYEAWAPGQPDNAFGEQHFAQLCMIFEDVGWNDARGSAAIWYLCEWETDSIQFTPAALRELTAEAGLAVAPRSAAQYHEQLLDRVTCNKQGVPLQNALVALLNQAEIPYTWIASDELPAAARPVNVKANYDRLRDVLESILTPRGLAYKVDDSGLSLVVRQGAPKEVDPTDDKENALSRKIRGEVIRWDPKTLRATVEYDFNAVEQLADWFGGRIDSNGRLMAKRSEASQAIRFTSIDRITFDGYLVSGRGRVTASLCKNIVAELGGTAHVLFQSDLRNPLIRATDPPGPSGLLRTTIEIADGRITWTLNRKLLGSQPLQEKPSWPGRVVLGNPLGDTRYDNVRITGVIDKQWLDARSGR